MKIHEYQAKALFAAYGIPTPRGKVAKTPEEALKAAQEIGSLPVVLKAQIHAGGRGKAGGVEVVKGLEAALQAAGPAQAGAAEPLAARTATPPRTTALPFDRAMASAAAFQLRGMASPLILIGI